MVTMTTCQHCERPTKARGLCAKHYMRLRRTGHAATITGRQPDVDRSLIRDMYAGEGRMSDRTFARFWNALQQYKALTTMGFIDPGTELEMLDASTRPNGSINVSRFAEGAANLVAEWREIHAGTTQ